jgi:hypothetical protein
MFLDVIFIHMHVSVVCVCSRVRIIYMYTHIHSHTHMLSGYFNNQKEHRLDQSDMDGSEETQIYDSFDSEAILWYIR